MIQDALAPLSVTACQVNLGNKTVSVSHLSEVDSIMLCNALDQKLLGARILETGSAGGERPPPSFWGALQDCDSMLCRSILAIQALLAALGFGVAQLGGSSLLLPPYAALLYALSAAMSHALFRRAWLSTLARKVSIHVLMVIALLGAAANGQMQEAAMVGFLVSASEWLMGRVHNAVEKAMDRNLSGSSKYATRLDPGGGQTVVAVSALQPGDVVILKTGEAIPVDGTVRKSARFIVDEARITGEALPVEKVKGSIVSSGTVVVGGAAEVVSSATAEDSFQGVMQRAVEDARFTTSKAEALVNRVAAVYTPCVIIGASVVAVMTGSASRGLTALVCACPCAFVAAAPVLQACSISRLLSELGILVKDARALENLAALRTLALDKTGTLTFGEFKMTESYYFSCEAGLDSQQILRMVAAVESQDPHPLAHAVVNSFTGCAAAFDAGAARLPAVSGFNRVESCGVWGVVDGHIVGAGSLDFLDAMQISVPSEADALRARWDAKGGNFTIIHCTLGEELVAMLRLEDRTRPEAREVVAALHKAGIRTAMLTGDRRSAAETVALHLGITEVCSGMKPLGKEEWIRRQQSGWRGEGSEVPAGGGEAAMESGLKSRPLIREKGYSSVVGIVGDGLNDAPALAAADVGICVASGLQLTADAGDVIVLATEGQGVLSRLLAAILTARRARHVLLQNLFLAFTLKVAALALAAFGAIGLSVGVAADSVSLLLVLLNSLRPLSWQLLGQ